MVFERDLIRFVKQRKCLYQTKSRSSKDKDIRLGEWHRVAAALRRPVIDCKQRWRSLRDRFVREKKKIDLGDVPLDSEQQWEYYDEMKFVIPSVKPRKGRQLKVDDGAKIYLNPEVIYNFANTTNSLQDEGPPSVVNENLSFDEMFDTETTTLHGYSVEGHPNNETEEIVSICDEEDYAEQKAAIKRNASFAFKNEDNDDHDFENSKYPIVKLSKPSPTKSENQKKNQHDASTSTPRHSAEAVTTTTSSVADTTGAFIELVNTVKSEITKVFVEEKDENDMFLDCMAKKMKKLSARAKLKIQAELLNSISEELLKEMKE